MGGLAGEELTKLAGQAAWEAAGYGDLLPPLITEFFTDYAHDPDWTGFGPGEYLDEYTGEGDRLYWGARDGSSSMDDGSAGNVPKLSFGPGGLVQQIVGGTGTLSETGTADWGSAGSLPEVPDSFGGGASSGYSGDGSSMISDPASLGLPQVPTGPPGAGSSGFSGDGSSMISDPINPRRGGTSAGPRATKVLPRGSKQTWASS